MYAAAIDAGVSHDTFWRLTLRQVYVHLESYERRLKGASQQLIESAWLASYIEVDSTTKKGRKLQSLRHYQRQFFPDDRQFQEEEDDLTRAFREGKAHTDALVKRIREEERRQKAEKAEKADAGE